MRDSLLVAAAFQQLSAGNPREVTLLVRMRARISPVQRQRDGVLGYRVRVYTLNRTRNLCVQPRHRDRVD